MRHVNKQKELYYTSKLPRHIYEAELNLVPNVEILHNNGLYVGNSQYVNSKKVDRLINILEEVNSNV